VTASTQKELEGHIPNYPNLPSRLICLLDNVTLHVCMDYGQTRLYKSRTDCRFAPFFLGGGGAQINLPCNYSVCLMSTQIFSFHSLLVFDWTQGERESKTSIILLHLGAWAPPAIGPSWVGWQRHMYFVLVLCRLIWKQMKCMHRWPWYLCILP